MMKMRLILYNVICLLCWGTACLPLAGVQAQEMKTIGNDMNGAKILYNTGRLSVETVYGDGQPYDRVTFAGCVQGNGEGLPSLPVYNRFMEIPVCEDVEVEVTYSSRRTLAAAELGVKHRLLPVQPHRSKSDSLPAAFVMDRQAYATDSSYGLPLASLRPVGVARSRRLAKLSIAPIEYNPVRQEITVYDGLTITIKYHKSDKKATSLLRQHESPVYPAPSGTIVMGDKPTKSVRTTAPLRYLIVAHSSFRGALDRFVEWKRRQGFITTVVYTNDAEVGTTTTSIGAYIKRQYTEATEVMPAPSYLLLVGDIAQIPAFRSKMNGAAVSNGHLTDLYYVTWTDDFVPDCYFGRFSANNVGELQPQIDKTLYYEQYAFEDPSYLGRAIMIAGVDSDDSYAYDYCDPSMDYSVSRYVNAANGFGDVLYYKNATAIVPPGVTVTGSSSASTTAARLRDFYSEGYGWINYSGHGVERGWVNPSFNTGHIGSMNNYGKPSIMIGNCCLSNHFNSENCFGEQLLRRGGNAGAAAYIGAMKETYWDDDFYWSVGMREAITPDMHAGGAHYDGQHLGMYDRLFHTGGEPHSQWAKTMGAMVHAGNMAVMEGDEEPYTHYYWEIYTVMGDPSLMPWLGEAKAMTLDYAQPVSRSRGTIVVNTEPYAYVSLTTMDGSQWVDAAFADAGGTAVLSFDNAIADSLLQVAAFAQNHIPAYGTVQLTQNDDIRMAISGLRTYNSVAGDTVDFSFRLANLGDDTLRFINYVLRGNPAEIQPLHAGEYWGMLAPRSSVQLNHVCRSLLDAGLTDQSKVAVTLQFISDTVVSTCMTEFVVDAPRLVVEHTAVEGVMAADSSVRVCVTLANRGHAASGSLVCGLRQPFDLAVVEGTGVETASLAPDSSVSLCYGLAIDSACEGLRQLPLELCVQRGGVNETIPMWLPFYSEDFESGDFSHLDWQREGQYPWVISQNAHSGRFAARSNPDLPLRGVSELGIAFACRTADSVEFDYLLSSVKDCNEFRVLVDGESVLSASGVADGWRHFVWHVDSGSHSIVFVYGKDCAGGDDDGVWIDGIVLPNVSTVAVRYLYDSVCQGLPYLFYGQEAATDSIGDFLYYHDAGDTLYSLRLSVLPVPQLKVLTSDSSVLPGQSAFLAVTGADTYRWSTGETTTYIQVAPSEVTTYYVVGYRSGCSAEDSITIGMRPLGIDFVSAMEVKVYPNPTSGIVAIEAPQMRQVALFDMFGKKLEAVDAAGERVQMSLATLPKGVYLVRIMLSDGVVTRKVTRQ